MKWQCAIAAVCCMVIVSAAWLSVVLVDVSKPNATPTQVLADHYKQWREYRTSKETLQAISDAHACASDIQNLFDPKSVHVNMVGSYKSGSFSPNSSDIDIQVTTKTCQGFYDACTVLEQNGFTREFSGPSFSLYHGISTRTVGSAGHIPLDVSVTVAGARDKLMPSKLVFSSRKITPTQTVPSNIDQRGFLEWVIRKELEDKCGHLAVRKWDIKK